MSTYEVEYLSRAEVLSEIDKRIDRNEAMIIELLNLRNHFASLLPYRITKEELSNG